MSEPDNAGATEVTRFGRTCQRTRVPDPCSVVLFGATGDLTHRKLVPALYHMAQGGPLPGEYAIVGLARRNWSDDQLRDDLSEMLKTANDERFARPLA